MTGAVAGRSLRRVELRLPSLLGCSPSLLGGLRFLLGGLPFLLGGLLALVGCLPACGYSTRRLTEDLAGARTISVAPFVNASYYRDVELRLTQAVANEIRARTAFGLSTTDRADLLMTGTMNIGQQAVALDKDQNPLVSRLYGTLDVTLTDRRTGRIVKTYTVAAMEEFAPEIYGESEQGSGVDEWTRRIAERVVQGLEAGF